MSDPDTARTLLLQWASEQKLTEAQLSEDGQTLSLGDTQLAASTVLSIESSAGKSCQYSLASIYLQIIDANQSLLVYRGACKKYKVTDPVTALDKPVVVGFFHGTASAPEETTTAAPAAKEKPRDKHRDERHKSSSRKDKDSKRKSSSSHDKRDRSRDDKHKKKKKEARTVTDEQLLSNLTAVADRRQEDGSGKNIIQQEEITKALSAEGFEVTPELLAEYKPKADYILANEIPVGTSASILQAMNPNKSLSRVMELFMETMHPKSSSSKSSKHHSSSSAGSSQGNPKKSYLIGKKPVIVVPKGMTAPITMINAYDFLSTGVFIPRDVMVKQAGGRSNPQAFFSRTVRNSGLLEYEIIDNPKKLGHDLKEWERIVAVVVLGQSWQFKDWPAPYNDAVQLFNRTFGYYIGMEGSKVPAEVMGWSVAQAQLSRDKRGMDKVTHANFWNQLDEYMTVHKRELLPQQQES